MMQFAGANMAFPTLGRARPAPDAAAEKDDGSVHRRRRKLVVVRSSGKSEAALLRHGRGTAEDAGRHTRAGGGGGGSTGVAGAAAKVATAANVTARTTTSPTRLADASSERKPCDEAPCHASTPAQHVTSSRTSATATGEPASPTQSPLAASTPTIFPQPPAAAAVPGAQPYKRLHSGHSAVRRGNMERRTPESPSPARRTKPTPSLTATTTAPTGAAGGTPPPTCASRFSRHGHGHVGINGGPLSQQHAILYPHSVSQASTAQPASNLLSAVVPLERRRFRDGARGASGGSDASEEQDDAQCIARGTSGLNAPLLSCDNSISTNEATTPPSRRRRPRGGGAAATEVSPKSIAQLWRQRHASAGGRPPGDFAARFLEHSASCLLGAGGGEVPEFVELCSPSKGAGAPPESAPAPTAKARRPRHRTFVVTARGRESVTFARAVAPRSAETGTTSVSSRSPRALKRVKGTPAPGGGGGRSKPRPCGDRAAVSPQHVFPL
ncbi:uncharacterized protein Tco025E_06160 [Trypanosoma conorhini]|uniref:Uncharacterized protein n=1 Tax=Trypanosoma conorhini TaxID=83891 RepID=A0A3R7KRI1_9TRYP|nr:uncharacterized protein Tco025E_06160 [Trypanosoma conorhini]RNF13910.1 hypothetical protein Tco025E_06160 [Trypanosoma conorhini]